MLQGGCFCGAIRYQTEGVPFHKTHCHCSICRRISGAPLVTWFSVPKASLQFMGEPPKYFRSSDTGTRGFCPHCGTPITFESANFPAEIDITLCSLDLPEALLPEDHTWTSKQMAWLQLNDGLPTYPEGRVASDIESQ